MDTLIKYYNILVSDNIDEIEKLLENRLNYIYNKITILDIILRTNETIIKKIFNIIVKKNLLKDFFNLEKYNPFYKLIEDGFFNNIIIIINLLDDKSNILTYSTNNSYWLLYFIEQCDMIDYNIYDFIDKYYKYIETNNDLLESFNIYFIKKLANYPFDKIKIYLSLCKKYKSILLKPDEYNYLTILFKYDCNKLIEKLIKIYPNKLTQLDIYGETPMYYILKYIDNSNKLDLIKIILKYNKDYSISFGDKDVCSYILINLIHQKDILQLFNFRNLKLNFKYETSHRSNYGHLIFIHNKSYLSLDMKRYFLEKINMNKINIYKQTPLHLLFKNDDYNKYLDIIRNSIKNKKLHLSTLFIKDIFNKSALDYLIKNNESPTDMIKLIFNKLKIKNKCINNKNIADCINSFINYTTYDDNQYKLITNIKANISNFNNGNNGDLYFLLLLVNKYSNLKAYCNTNFSIDDYISSSLINKYQNIISNLKKNNKLITIYWYNKYINIIPKNLFDYFNKIYRESNNKIYLFIIPIRIYILYNIDHANICFINYKTKLFIRFEPYGTFYKYKKSNIDLDNYLYNYIRQYSDFTYVSPTDYLNNINFQTNEEELIINNIGDPGGFCLAWCLWFIETMILHHDKITSVNKLKKLMEILLTKLLYQTIPAQYIKNYASNLQLQLFDMFNKYQWNTKYIYMYECNNQECTDIIDSCYKLLSTT
jgi:hypothetical protein